MKAWPRPGSLVTRHRASRTRAQFRRHRRPAASLGRDAGWPRQGELRPDAGPRHSRRLLSRVSGTDRRPRHRRRGLRASGLGREPGSTSGKPRPLELRRTGPRSSRGPVSLVCRAGPRRSLLLGRTFARRAGGSTAHRLSKRVCSWVGTVGIGLTAPRCLGRLRRTPDPRSGNGSRESRPNPRLPARRPTGIRRQRVETTDFRLAPSPSNWELFDRALRWRWTSRCSYLRRPGGHGVGRRLGAGGVGPRTSRPHPLRPNPVVSGRRRRARGPQSMATQAP